MNGGLRLGRILGIEIVVDASWLVVAFLVWWAVYVELDRQFPGAAAAGLLAISAIAAIAFFGSVLGHELSHSLVANRRGLGVHRIRLFIFGGVSELAGEAPTPQDEFAVTIAGPLSSFGFGLAFWALAVPLSDGSVVAYALRFLAATNVMLGVFNLLPGFPLDGGRVLRSAVWRVTGDRQRATRAAVWGGRVLAGLLMGSGLLVVFVGRSLVGLWSVAIGWFLLQAANSSLRQLEVEDMLRGVVAAQVMTPDPVVVGPDLTLQELFDGYVMTRNHSSYPVVAEGRLVGLIGLGRLRAVPRPDWPQRRVGEVMHPAGEVEAVDPAAPVAALLPRLAGEQRRIVVVADGAPIGIIAAVDVARWLERAGL